MYRCGGTKVVATSLMSKAGLSPRVRGNRTKAGQLHLHWRSIPACAGEPPRSSTASNIQQVYPRVCGGTTKIFDGKQHPAGLSPRVRGNRFVVAVMLRVVGSIPACAGEPLAFQLMVPPISVYPRVCGGTRQLRLLGYTKQGLSPRVRGNRLERWEAPASDGSIPACAGEPKRKETRDGNARVYPRVCGGTKPGSSVPPSITGLSPRVRGNHHPEHVAGAGVRSIPACAGEPIPHVVVTARVWVYPRVCGGTSAGQSAAALSPGLSPRVRGNQDGGEELQG